MNILFVIPPSVGRKKIIRQIDCSHEAKANYLWHPNDFLIISSHAKNEDRTFLIDGTCDELPEWRFMERLMTLRSEVDLVFFALSSVCWRSDYYYFNKTRELFPKAKFYVIGDIFIEKHYQDLILDHCHGIIYNPYVVDLEKMAAPDENPVLEGVCNYKDRGLLDGIRKKMTFVKTGTPRHELFRKKGYRFPFSTHYEFATVTTMYGCPFSCSYCTDSKIPPVSRYYQDVLNELDYLSRLGIKELFFADKVFGFLPENVEPLLATMAKEYEFTWSCYFHPQIYTEKLLNMMREAGCHTIIIGVDSANLPSLTKYRRNVKRAKLEALIKHANDIKINICADLILGLPHETENDIINTVEYALSLPLDYASFNIAAPLPGSDIREKARQDGKLDFGREGYDTFGHEGILDSENIVSHRLKAIRDNAVRRFYLRPAYLLRRIRRTQSLDHFMIQLAEMMSLLRKTFIGHLKIGSE